MARMPCRGDLGTAIAVTNHNIVKFLPSREPAVYKWSDYDSVIVAGPSLIMRGVRMVIPRDEGFKSGVHYSRRIRSAVGLTRGNKLVMVTTGQKLYLGESASAMRRWACVDAAVLDGGSSTGLYCNGRPIRNPGRGITSCLLVYDDTSAYEQRRACLYPQIASSRQRKAESR